MRRTPLPVSILVFLLAGLCACKAVGAIGGGAVGGALIGGPPGAAAGAAGGGIGYLWTDLVTWWNGLWVHETPTVQQFIPGWVWLLLWAWVGWTVIKFFFPRYREHAIGGLKALFTGRLPTAIKKLAAAGGIRHSQDVKS